MFESKKLFPAGVKKLVIKMKRAVHFYIEFSKKNV